MKALSVDVAVAVAWPVTVAEVVSAPSVERSADESCPEAVADVANAPSVDIVAAVLVVGEAVAAEINSGSNQPSGSALVSNHANGSSVGSKAPMFAISYFRF